MTNDTTTLNGALRELGETMARNLSTMGVTSTYDEGLSTLASKILTIHLEASLSSDTDVLSYADSSSSAVLTATVLEAGSALTGETVKFYKYVDGTNDVLLGSDVTDSNGEASYTYASAGIGDFEVYAKVRGLESESCSIEDCLDYQPMTTNAHQSRWSIPSAVTSSSIFGYSSDGWKFGNASSYSTISAVDNQTLPYSMEFTVTNRYNKDNNPSPIFGAYFGSNYLMVACSSNNIVIYVNGSQTTYAYSYPSTFTVRMEITSNTISVYIDDVLIGSETHSFTGNSVPTFQTGVNRWNVIKDYKIKPL